MTYAPANIKEFASKRETSIEIALAIFEIAPEGQEDAVWTSPLEPEKEIVIRRAFELAESNKYFLFWGNEKCYRPFYPR